MAFGVDADVETKEFHWDRFRQLAKLEQKLEETLTDYYLAFTAMCKRVCKKPMTKIEGWPLNAIIIIDVHTCVVIIVDLLITESLSAIPESVTEERANKVLQRIEFMNRIRAALRHDEYVC